MISRGFLVAGAAALVSSVTAVAGSAAVAGGARADAERKPAIVLVSDGPVALRGRGFASRERLTVRVSISRRVYTKRLRATALGTFTVRFADAAITECDPFSVSVTGSAGSRAGLSRKIQIPPACGIAPQP